MKLIIGLGNPEKKYQHTKHNLGFMVIDELFKELNRNKREKWIENKELRVEYFQFPQGVLAKPMTSMNASGIGVANLISHFLFSVSDLWVIHDDLDLPLGKIRIKTKGGSGGHRGVESIIKKLGTPNFVRFRLGIGRPDSRLFSREVEKYVLSPFEKKDRSEVRKMIRQVVEAIEFALENGLEKAMNRFNQ